MNTPTETPATKNQKLLQVAFTAIFVAFTVYLSVERAFSIDPIGPDGVKCYFVNYNPKDGRQIISNAENEKINAEFMAAGKNPFGDFDKDAALFGLAEDKASAVKNISGWSFNCRDDKKLLIADLRLHPVASLFGAIIASILSIPIVYWVIGWQMKRYQARMAAYNPKHKTCPYCAEKIKSEAIVCRYCGRDIPS